MMKILSIASPKTLLIYSPTYFLFSELQDFYYKIPEDQPIHIARVWDRYSVNEGENNLFDTRANELSPLIT